MPPIIISHRGNLSGKGSAENSPQTILRARREGYHVEIDVRKGSDGKLWLGHDSWDYMFDTSLLKWQGSYVWVHCKDVEAVEILLSKRFNGSTPHMFAHSTDRFVLTSDGYIWVFPGQSLGTGVRSIAVLPENVRYSLYDLSTCYGICTDYPAKMAQFMKDYDESSSDTGRALADVQADYQEFLDVIQSVQRS